MSRVLTAADRSALIRLASTLPAGSAERRAILAGLSRVSMSPHIDRILSAIFRGPGLNPQAVAELEDEVKSMPEEEFIRGIKAWVFDGGLDYGRANEVMAAVTKAERALGISVPVMMFYNLRGEAAYVASLVRSAFRN